MAGERLGGRKHSTAPHTASHISILPPLQQHVPIPLVQLHPQHRTISNTVADDDDLASHLLNMSARRQPSSTSLSKYANTAHSQEFTNRSLDFCNAFWGIADGGVDVLFARMRGATRTMEELRNFWKERYTFRLGGNLLRTQQVYSLLFSS